MTVGELREKLQGIADDVPISLKTEKGYENFEEIDTRDADKKFFPEIVFMSENAWRD